MSSGTTGTAPREPSYRAEFFRDFGMIPSLDEEHIVQRAETARAALRERSEERRAWSPLREMEEVGTPRV